MLQTRPWLGPCTLPHGQSFGEPLAEAPPLRSWTLRRRPTARLLLDRLRLSSNLVDSAWDDLVFEFWLAVTAREVIAARQC